MTFNEWAILLLNSDKLEDKLSTPDDLTDKLTSETVKLPDLPARSKGLGFNENRSEKRPSFPSLSQLERPTEAGKVLHFFANHELLAVELMALALLKFRDAPKAFRKGIVETIKEEQVHLKKYLSRMETLGVEFGDIPVNDFFWKHSSKMKTPMDYVTQMSMTFEQANLDFSLYYQKAFERIEDKATAQLLNEVYEDEVGHVKFGVHWFDQWRDKEKTQWECFMDALPFPLTPARAKGKDFARETRDRTGLDEDFVNHLEIFAHSKGRAPRVYLFNPDSELSWANRGYSRKPRIEDFAHDLEDTLLFLAKQDDLVLMKERPSREFLTDLSKLKALPEIRSAEIKSLKGRKFNELCPWGWTPQLLKEMTPLLDGLPSSAPKPPSLETMQKVASKTFAAQVLSKVLERVSDDRLCPPEVIGRTITSVDDLQSESEDFVFKSPYGFSGINSRRGIDLKWIQNRLNEQGSLLVEPWLDRVMDFSIQIYVRSQGVVNFMGISRFLTDERGQYKGCIVGQPDACMKVESRRRLHQGGPPNTLFEKLAQEIGGQLYEEGYLGPAGIDGFMYYDEKRKEHFIKPISEINSRFNFGNINLALGKLLHRGKVGLWLITPKDKLPENLPESTIFTSDMKKARQFASFLSVFKNETELLESPVTKTLGISL